MSAASLAKGELGSIERSRSRGLALVGVDDQHVFTLVETVHGADFDAVGIFAFDAGFSDDVSHPGLRTVNFVRVG